MAFGLLVTLVAAVGVAAPVATASPDVEIRNGPTDCLAVNETGTIDVDIPACRRFVQNITN